MRKWLKRTVYLLPLFAAIVIALAGPLPSPEIFHRQPYKFGTQNYELRSAQNLAATAIRVGAGELRVGVGVSNIDPENGQPLMGFVNSGVSRGVASPSFAKAVTVSCGDTAITLVALDIFILLPRLADAVISASGLAADEIYFTASHTHHSVGGWADGRIEQFFYGKYAPRYFAKLTAQIAAAIKISRENFVPATVAYRRAATDNFLQNRIYPHTRPAREIAEAIIFRRQDNGEPLATLLTFAAHPTTESRDYQYASADYPGVWRDLWEKNFGGIAMFAAGYVGDARANPQLATPEKSLMQTLGEKLFETLQSAPETAMPVDQIAALRLPVIPPPIRLPLGASWRWFPLTLPLYYPRATHLSALKLGDLALVGFPADFAGELAPPLETFAENCGLKLIATSFNGDWRGYFLTPETFRERNSYERRMGLSGAEAGAMFSELAIRAIASLAASTPKTPESRH